MHLLARRWGFGAVAVTMAIVVSSAIFSPARGSARGRSAALHPAATAQTAAGSLAAQPMLGMPGSDLEVVGASPGEAAGETWAQGTIGAVPAAVGATTVANAEVLMRYTAATGAWQVVPIDTAQGAPVGLGPQYATEVTAGGGVVIAGMLHGAQTLVVRNPGGAFTPAPAPPTGTLLGSETLFSDSNEGLSTSNVPTMAAIDESGQAGVLIAPADEDSSAPGVLHYVGGQWSREPICATYSGVTCTAPSQALTPVALAASSPSSAWLIAIPASGASGAPMLFERDSEPSGETWVQIPVASPLLTGTNVGSTTVALTKGPVLTATSQGVWVDLSLSDGASTGSGTVLVAAGTGATLGTWCYPTSLCPAGAGSLGAPLPDNYGSFAWPGTSTGDPGVRYITGLPGAAMLSLSEGGAGFAYDTTAGDQPGILGGGGTFGPGGETLIGAGNNTISGDQNQSQGGAAFASPDDGWLGSGLTPPHQSPEVIRLTTTPGSDQLITWPIPFRDPLLAVTGAPGAADPADGQTQALAVGVNGEVVLYTPGEGWAPEFLYNAAGQVQTPTLRGVAWPEPGRAYAVGDNGAMWLYQQDTQQWEPDPAKPLNFHGNLTAIAFSPSNPALGYAVGKQGVLLAYGKTWTQQAVPASVANANFTSVAFAGDEVLVGYRIPIPNSASGQEQGGLLVNNGAGWQVEPSVQALLAQLPAADTVISKVAGLPDGAAVLAGPGVIIERNSLTAAWRFSTTPLADTANGNISAVAAIQNGGPVQALVSVDDDPGSDPSGIDNDLWQFADSPPAPAVGQPPLLLGPDPLPSHGFLVRETATGWNDMELADYANQLAANSGEVSDLPGWPDPVLGLLVSPTGTDGWAVGGQTGGDDLQLNGADGAALAVDTAGIERFGPGPSPPGSTSAPVSVPSGEVSLEFGGGSGCAAACSDNAAQHLGPNAWLAGALARAGQVGGVGAYVYLGSYVGARADSLSIDAFNRELAEYSSALSSTSSLPVYAAASAQDAADGSGDFASMLGGHVPAGGTPAGTPAPPAGTAAYAFTDHTSGGTVRVIVLDYSSGSLEADGQLTWMDGELDAAKAAGVPAIVAGAADITDAGAPNYASDAATVQQALLGHGASAYVFLDDGQQNVSETIGRGAGAIPALGTGTLGYVDPPTNAVAAEEFLGASGSLLISVNAGSRNAATNVAPVTTQLIPNVGELALDAVDGTLLPRSEPALFEGLARRPIGGEEFIGGSDEEEAPDPYTLLPETCLGTSCGKFIEPSYTFTSSNPQIGQFVKHDPSATNPLQVYVNASGQPVADNTSGLFCPFNPGTTTVTITSGGASYSEAITIEQGSVRLPCGTVPVTATTENPGTSVPPLQGHSPGRGPSPTTNPSLPLPPNPVHPAPVPPPAKQPGHPSVRPLPTPLAPLPAVVPVVPLRPILPVAGAILRPIPPAGFGTVSSTVPLSVRAVERQREDEEAVESARNSFARYQPGAGASPVAPLALLVLALGAGASGAAIRRTRRRSSEAYARLDRD